MDIDYYKRRNGDFYRRIGVVNCANRLTALGLKPRDVIGSFWSEDAVDLLEFCRANPEYHIVTTLSFALTLNRYLKGNYRYRLADGDSDPALKLDFPPEVVAHLDTELDLFIRSAKTKI